MGTTQEVPMATADDHADDIDLLIPRPWPWWARLLVGLTIVGSVGTLAALWGLGFLYPSPECCGSGSGSAPMALSADGQAVTVSASMFNSSGRDLRISAATVDLPGARVLAVTTVAPDNDTYPVSRTVPLPATVKGTKPVQLLITFVPTTCIDTARRWGTVDVQLHVTGSPFPSASRRYRLPDPVVDLDHGGLAVFSPDGFEGRDLGPLQAACRLLGRTA